MWARSEAASFFILTIMRKIESNMICTLGVKMCIRVIYGRGVRR